MKKLDRGTETMRQEAWMCINNPNLSYRVRVCVQFRCIVKLSTHLPICNSLLARYTIRELFFQAYSSELKKKIQSLQNKIRHATYHNFFALLGQYTIQFLLINSLHVIVFLDLACIT